MKNFLFTVLIGLWTSVLAFASTPVLSLKGTWPDAAGDFIEEVSVVGDYAYLANGLAGLRIINISNPAMPIFVGAVDTTYLARGVAVQGNYAYIADWGNRFNIIDVADPSHPVHRGSYATSAGIDVAVSGDYAYYADYDGGVAIIDITDPDHPRQASWFGMHRCNALVIQGGYVFAAGIADGLFIIDVRDPLKPILASKYKIASFEVHEVTVSGHYAYLIGLAQSSPWIILDVVDISDVNNPTSVGQLELSSGYSSGYYGYYLATIANYVLVGDAASTLRLVDVADPTKPIVVSTYYGQHPAAKNTRRPLASGGLIYWLVGEYGLEILSIEQAPSLSISPLAGQGMVQVKWDQGPGIKLQKTHDLTNPLWEDVLESTGDGSLPVSKSEANCFFRVVKENP